MGSPEDHQFKTSQADAVPDLDTIQEKAQEENEEFDRLNLERQIKESARMAEELLDGLEEAGITNPDRGKAIKLLTSPAMANFELKKFAGIFGIDLNDQKTVDRVNSNEEFRAKFNQLLRAQLVTREYKEVLLDRKMDFIGPGQVEVFGQKVELSDLSDSELTEKGIEPVRDIVREILHDKNSKAAQGMFRNTLIPEKLGYVIKTEKNIDNRSLVDWDRRSVYTYPLVKKYLGSEFLLRQAVLKSPDSDQLHVFQEKLNDEEAIDLNTENIDKFIDGGYAPNIKKALGDDANQQKLRNFIAGANELYRQTGLMIDVSPHNLYFKVEEDGSITIKLIDYGGHYQWPDEEENNEITKSLAFLNKLSSRY